MNILIINSANEWGGNEKWSLAAASGLAGRGHRVYFGCRSPLFWERAGGCGVTFVRFPCANNADLFSAIAMALFMRNRAIDVVIPTRQRDYLLGGLAALPFRRVKVVARLGIDRPLHNRRNRFAFKKLFDGVIVNAERIVRTLGETPGFDPSRCRVVRNGVAIPPLSAEVRARMRRELGLEDNELCVMGIGRLAPQKGFDYAIASLAVLAEKYPLVKLVIAGGGDREGLRRLAEKAGVATKVVFAGFRSDIPELLQAADLFWMTSRSEGLPNVMLEAMAAKIPVAAFDVAGVSEVLKNGVNGFVTAFEDTGGIVAATEKLIQNPALRRRLGEAGHQTVLRDHSLEKMAGEIERYLEEVLKRPA